MNWEFYWHLLKGIYWNFYIKSRTKMKSKRLREESWASRTKYRDTFLWARHFLHMSFSAFKVCDITWGWHTSEVLLGKFVYWKYVSKIYWNLFMGFYWKTNCQFPNKLILIQLNCFKNAVNFKEVDPPAIWLVQCETEH